MNRSAAVAALVLLAAPASAAADGPSVGGSTQWGVAVGSSRYVALTAGRGTVLARLAVPGGRPLYSRYVRRQIGIPSVAFDGTGGGLSQDGKTLVLTRQWPRYPQRSTELYFANPQTLGILRTVRLRGNFAFDAISPDGGTTYLIQVDNRDPLRYAVRAMDTASGRLLPEPIVDRREPDEEMRGYPVTRTSSPEGRVAYTLYNGGKHPFVHALDTVGRSAACIDLPRLPEGSQFKLRLGGHRLAVLADGAPVAYVDTVTRAVSRPGAPSAEPPRSHGGGSGSLPWALIAGGAAAALAAAGLLAARRPRATADR